MKLQPAIISFIVILQVLLALLILPSRSECSDVKSNAAYTVNDIEFLFKKTVSFDENTLLNIMSLPKIGDFNQENLEADKQRIRKFYFDNGFFDAVIDTMVTYNEDKSVDITIIIIENARYTIETLRFKGLANLPDKPRNEINSEKLINAGEPYNKELISKETSRIIEILHNNGYAKARLDTNEGTVVAKYLQDFASYRNKVVVDVTFIGVEKVYYFGSTRIIISNNIYRLGPELIKRELAYKEGELYNRDLMTRTDRNLSKLAIIQLGRVQIDTIKDDESKVNLIVNINLNNKYEVTPSLIGVYIDNRFYVGAGIQYSDKNFFGGGRVFTIKLEGLIHSSDVNRAELGFSLFQPFFVKNTITATLNTRLGLYNKDERTELTTLRNLLRFTYFIAEHTFYQNAYSDITADLIRTKTKKDYTDPSTGEFLKSGNISNQMNSIIGITLIHNSTNDIFTPSKGIYHSLTLENAGLLPRLINLINQNTSFSQYFKFYIPNRFFYDISRGRASSILALNFEVGDIMEYGAGKNIEPVSLIYKFYSGGGTSIRGWRSQENGILADPSSGGTFLIEGSVELRRYFIFGSAPVWKNIGMLFFFDYGNVWEKDDYFRLDQISMAVGFGLRYNTLVGPVTIDLGFKLYDPNAPPDKKWLFDSPGDIFKNKYAINFGLGNAF